MRNSKKLGFTLIEVLVVIAIISILLSIALTAYNSARNKARGAAVTEAMISLRNQGELLIGSDGKYPANICNLPINGEPVCFAGNCYGNLDHGPLYKEASYVRKYLTTWSLRQVYCTIDTTIGIQTADKPSNWAAFAMIYPNGPIGTYFCVDSSGFAGSSYMAGPGGKCIVSPW